MAPCCDSNSTNPCFKNTVRGSTIVIVEQFLATISYSGYSCLTSNKAFTTNHKRYHVTCWLHFTTCFGQHLLCLRLHIDDSVGSMTKPQDSPERHMSRSLGVKDPFRGKSKCNRGFFLFFRKWVQMESDLTAEIPNKH